MAKRYEVQVLDSYDNPTYADGQAAAIFGQYPPLVNASRPPGQWQTYDIIWHGPRFDASGALLATRPDHRLSQRRPRPGQRDAVWPTAFKRRPPYTPQPAAMPLELQDHSYPVRFRDIWVRAIPDVMTPRRTFDIAIIGSAPAAAWRPTR